MADYLVRFYFEIDGNRYRVKVFERTVWIERQPDGGTNLAFLRETFPVWNEQLDSWNLRELIELVNTYEAEIKTPR